MKVLKSIFLLSLLLILNSSFTSSSVKSDLVGLWVYEKYEDNRSIYVKKNRFEEAEPGMKFLANGKFIQKRNVGWCGTPPITYGKYSGEWKMLSDSIVKISYKYNRDVISKTLVIDKISSKSLSIRHK